MINEMNWMQVEKYLERDDRAVLPLGSVEQHGYLSLAVDSILAERIAREAAAPLGVPVFLTVNYGLAPYFAAYPGSLSLRLDTYARILTDLLDGLACGGFRRVLIVNGHGGNGPGHGAVLDWMNDNPEVAVKWHDWWKAPRTWQTVQEIDPAGSHASWMENFAWTRVAGVDLPEGAAPMTDTAAMRLHDARGVRRLLGDGNMGGDYQKSDEVMERLWQAGVLETRAALEGPWR